MVCRIARSQPAGCSYPTKHPGSPDSYRSWYFSQLCTPKQLSSRGVKVCQDVRRAFARTSAKVAALKEGYGVRRRECRAPASEAKSRQGGAKNRDNLSRTAGNNLPILSVLVAGIFKSRLLLRFQLFVLSQHTCKHQQYCSNDRICPLMVYTCLTQLIFVRK